MNKSSILAIASLLLSSSAFALSLVAYMAPRASVGREFPYEVVSITYTVGYELKVGIEVYEAPITLGVWRVYCGATLIASSGSMTATSTGLHEPALGLHPGIGYPEDFQNSKATIKNDYGYEKTVDLEIID